MIANWRPATVESAASEVCLLNGPGFLMVERYRRGKGKRRMLGNHQKSWIWGRNLVLETLRAGNWLPMDLLLSEELATDVRSEAEQLAHDQDIPFERVEPARIRQLCGTSEHQGFAAKMPEFPYANVHDLAAIVQENDPVMLLICDRIQDPFNLGAMLRSADGFGVSAVIIPDSEQVGVTSLVARTSAGAVNHVPIVQCESLTDVGEQLRDLGVSILACSEKAESNIGLCDLTRSVALVVGNEGKGVSRALLDLADSHVRIPLQGAVSSLNAAVAAAVVMYEVQRQQRSVASDSGGDVG